MDNGPQPAERHELLIGAKIRGHYAIDFISDRRPTTNGLLTTDTGH